MWCSAMVSKMTTQGAQARAQKEASDEALPTPLQDPGWAGSSEGQLRKVAIFTVATDTIQIFYTSGVDEPPFFPGLPEGAFKN